MFKGTAGHAYPFYYYFLIVPLGFFPWTAFIPAAFWRGFSATGVERDEREKIHFLLLWFLVPLFLLSLFRTKLATYVVPLFPPLAILVGHYWEQIARKRIAISRPLLWSMWFLALSHVGLMFGGIVYTHLDPRVTAGIPPSLIWIGRICLTVASIVMVIALVRRRLNWFFRLEAVILCITSMLALIALPSIQFKNSKSFSDTIMELKKPGDEVIMFRHYYASLPFYLGERILAVGVPTEVTFEPKRSFRKYVIPHEGAIRMFIAGPKRVFVLTEEEDFQRLESQGQSHIYALLRQQGQVLFSNEA